MESSPTAFTLVELLVVITIIVVLLALLSPALDRAIYQAELAVCAARLKTVATGVQVYAAENKRRYPHRPTVGTGHRPFTIYLGTTNKKEDDRPYLARHMSLNHALNDPLSKNVKLADADADSAVNCSYSLWHSWRWSINASDKGMYKIGDRFTWTDAEGSKSFSLLASDQDGFYFDRSQALSDHPDPAGVMSQLVYDSEDTQRIGVAVDRANEKLTFSLWRTLGGEERGTIDMNYAYDDGSVRRFTDVPPAKDYIMRDERMMLVPQSSTGVNPEWQYQVPKE